MATPFTLSTDELALLRWGDGKSFRWLVQFDGFVGTPGTDDVLFPPGGSDGYTVTALYAAEPTRHLGASGLEVRVLFSPTATRDSVLELLDRIRERVADRDSRWAAPDSPPTYHPHPTGFTAWYRRVGDEPLWDGSLAELADAVGADGQLRDGSLYDLVPDAE